MTIQTENLTGIDLLAEINRLRKERNPALLSLAKGAARDAVRQNLEIPLQVAGYKEVTVTVRFDGEAPTPQP